MDLQEEVHKAGGFTNLELLARQVVEGFISGMHKSPFHGYSAEFAEHRNYNNGESTKHIDWKLYARTNKLFTKRYEEETNLRCHLIIDNSSSMHYPQRKEFSMASLNKIGFSDTSTIHNAWVEALVGTGMLGVLLLILAALYVLVGSWRFKDKDVAPLVLTLCLLLRTVTGSSFEIFGLGALLFGWLCLAVPSMRRNFGTIAERQTRQLQMTP